MNNHSKIYVAGHKGLVGSAIMRALEKRGCVNIVTKTSSELDLRNQAAVDEFFAIERPEFVFLAAAKVGGIMANNTYRAEFIYDNLQIELNVIHSAWQYGVTKLLFLGSSCIYPKMANQPMSENELLSGELEYTNEPYAIAKIAGIKLCESYNIQYGTNFIAAMPTNLYGINDNFNLETSHVLPAMMRKFHEAKIQGKKEVTLWGTGTPRREFLFVDDLADASLFLMEHVNFRDITQSKNDIRNSHINIGTGLDVSIKELAEIVREIVGFKGSVVWDSTKPDGTPRKLLDVVKIESMGWKSKTPLKDGIWSVYQWYKESFVSKRGDL